MGITFLLWHEDPNHVSCPVNRTLVDQFATMFGYGVCHVDTYGALGRKVGNVFASLDEARRAPSLVDHSWVYFDHAGDQFLDEFDHPPRDVVYATGSDMWGYGRPLDSLDGPVLRLRTVVPDRHDWHAFPTILAAMCDRWTRLRA